ncbi:MAG: response regulator [Clostridiales bacterium]|jgi:two-component system response regulator YesN|nr:response regulator [Clostridiales bacterium]
MIEEGLNVLVVDDQASVVEGILSGVDWESANVSTAYKASNAFEAKSILASERVDIVLCDIEMPVESGLDVLRYTREMKMDAVFILLTAHADVSYAIEALRHGSFDYILQPAPYAEITRALIRAAGKIAGEKSQKSFMLEREKAVEALMRGWFSDLPDQSLEDALLMLGVPVTPGKLVCIARIHVEPDVCTQQLIHQAKEAFSRYGQTVYLTKIRKSDFCLLICPQGQYECAKDKALSEMEKLLAAWQNAYSVQASCCLSALKPNQNLSHSLEAVNMAFLSKQGVLDADLAAATACESKLPDMLSWRSILAEGDGSEVLRQAEEFFANYVSPKSLKRFYHSFLQMSSLALEQAGIPLDTVYPNDEAFQLSLKAQSSAQDALAFIRHITGFFNKSELQSQSSQLRQIIRYVHENLDSELRRETIAEAVFLHPNYMSSFFKQEMGISLKEFITGEKMKLARTLLRTTSLSVSVIAQKTGYSNFSHFSQVYKRYFDVSPASDREAPSD